MTLSHRPQKSLGQNFLHDQKVQARIINSCELRPTDTVVEIGPGKGALSTRILPLVKKLIVVEKDRQLTPLLIEQLQPSGGEIVSGDFLKWDMKDLDNDLVVIGNIPYYISTPIIEKIIENKSKIRRAFLTVQLEFGQRLAASAGNKEYGSLTCFVQYHADVKILFKISRGSFQPAPNVDSCFISLDLKQIPDHAATDEKKLFQLIQTSFMQRRKTIINAMKTNVGNADLRSLLDELGIDPQSRPEDLTLLNYIELSNSLML